MVRIDQHPVLAVDQPLDELVERFVTQRDVRTAKGRDDVDTGALKGFALEDDDGRRSG